MIRALLRPISELTSDEWSEVLAFGSRFFEGAWDSSLRTKHELVMLRDGGGALVGMGAVELFEVDGSTIIHVGNTAFADETRGQSHVQRLGFRYFLRAKLRHPLRPVYLAYTTFSWRTYLMLTRNFARSWPRREQPLPEREGALYRKIGTRLLGDRFESETGLVRNLDRRLRADIAALPEKLAEDADAQFFAALNPGYASGDAVLCLAPLDARNWWSVARRASRRASRG